MIARIIVFLTFAALVACNDAGQQKETAASKDSTASTALKLKTALEAEPLLQRADSMQILYYDNPDGDSLRYARYFKYTNAVDTAVVNGLLNNFRQPIEPRTTVKECRSEGKIYLFGKGRELKTVYFSTRCDTCCYLYFIKDGSFVYSPLSVEFANTLKENKKNSREPKD